MRCLAVAGVRLRPRQVHRIVKDVNRTRTPNWGSTSQVGRSRCNAPALQAAHKASHGGAACFLKRRARSRRNYPGSVKASDGGRALIVLSTVSKGLAPVLRRTVATTVRTAASPLADHMARYPFV